MFHIAGLTLNGFTGVSPITLQRESIGLGIAAQRFGAKLFGNGTKLGGLLSHPSHLSVEAAERIEASLKENFGGIENAHKVLVGEEGMTWTTMSMTAEDSQFLETRNYQRSEIAGIFRVPPHLIGDLTRATFSNIGKQDQAFVKHTIAPILVRIEKSVEQQLLTRDERKRFFLKYNVNALLRGDPKERAQALQIQRQNGVINANEWREVEDMNPREDDGGDEYVTMLNMGETSGENDDEKDGGDEPGRGTAATAQGVRLVGA